jgi:hypothetical protein
VFFDKISITMQYSAKDVAQLTVVAVVSCLVGYFGTVYLTQPAATFHYAPAQTAVRPATIPVAAVPQGYEVEVAEPAMPAQVRRAGAAAVTGMATMAPIAAQATEISGGSVPTPVLYFVFLVLGSAFTMGSFLALKAVKLLN